MKTRKFIAFLLVSVFIHLFLFLLIPGYSLLFRVENIPIQIEESLEQREHSSQIVDQYSFNRLQPKETKYFSQYNHTTLEEVKGKMKKSPHSTASPGGLGQNADSSVDLSPLDSFSEPFYGRIDHLENVEKEGAETLLNTKEIWFYTFNSRVKHQIYWHWIRELDHELKNLKIQNKFPTLSQTLTTHIEALLDEKGHLSSIIIRKKSGLEELDRASANSIRKAHPFPNPPPALIAEDGAIRLQYTFALSDEDTTHTSF